MTGRGSYQLTKNCCRRLLCRRNEPDNTTTSLFDFRSATLIPLTVAGAADGATTTGRESMMRSRRFAIAMLAAATVVVGSLATPSTASAMDCSTARVLQSIYYMTGEAFFYMGKPTSATYWYGRAAGITDGACG